MPTLVRVAGSFAGERQGQGEGDLAEAGGERGHLFGEEELALMKEADVGGEGFDFGEVVRGDEDGGAGGVGDGGEGFVSRRANGGGRGP